MTQTLAPKRIARRKLGRQHRYSVTRASLTNSICLIVEAASGRDICIRAPRTIKGSLRRPATDLRALVKLTVVPSLLLLLVSRQP